LSAVLTAFFASFRSRAALQLELRRGLGFKLPEAGPGEILTDKSGAGTSFWSLELNRFYVAAPPNDKEEAAILVFEPPP
jgi:hypothetical protein